MPAPNIFPQVDMAPFAIYDGNHLRQEELPGLFNPSTDRLDDLEAAFVESGHQINPDMTTDASNGIDVQRVREDRHRLIEFRGRLSSLIPQDQPCSSAVAEAYDARTAFDISITHLVVAGVRKNWTEFRRHNEEVFGSIDDDLDNGVRDWFANEATEALNDGRPEVEAAARRVLDAVGRSNGRRELLVPKVDVFEATKRQSWEPGGFLHQLFENIDVPPGMVTERDGDAILMRMAHNLGATSTKLRVGRGFAYHPAEDELERPPHYELTSQDFREYWAHESLHMKEGITEAPLQLVRTGLDHYSLGEEGNAIIPEQVANDTFQDFAKERRWHMILARHLAVSLGTGIYGREQSLSSVELYGALKDAFFVYESRREDMESLEDSTKRAHEQAWELLSIVKAGTDGSAESGVVAWVLPYAGGNVGCWRLEEGKPGAYAREAVGNWDRTNAGQRRILTAVGAIAT